MVLRSVWIQFIAQTKRHNAAKITWVGDPCWLVVAMLFLARPHTPKKIVRVTLGQQASGMCPPVPYLSGTGVLKVQPLTAYCQESYLSLGYLAISDHKIKV